MPSGTVTRVCANDLAVSVTATALWVSPDAPREVDTPMLADVPDPHGWPTGLEHERKLQLNGLVDSQLLLGEPVQILEERGDWVSVIAPWQPSDKDARGYPGWVRHAHLAARPAESDAEAVVAVRATTLAPAEPGADDPKLVASYGTILPVLETGPDSVLVELPGATRARLDRSACVVYGTSRDRPVEPDAVLATARRFVGLDYLWAGTSTYGLDCSGLVHLAFRALGKVVPRDAHDQAAAAAPVPLAESRPGDLLFFARPGKGIHHVGFATGVDGELLHAPRTGRQVVAETMDDDRRATLTAIAGRLTVD